MPTRRRWIGRRAPAAALLPGALAVGIACAPSPRAIVLGSAKGSGVLLITVEALSRDRLGCYGDRDAATPAIDALARDGVRFSNAFAQSPLTEPSLASIQTGHYPGSHGVRGGDARVLSDRALGLAEALGSAGYATAAVVEGTALGAARGLDRGFETFDEEPVRSPPPIDTRGDSDATGGPAGAPAARETTGRAVRWLSAPRTAPFFLWVHYAGPYGSGAAYDRGAAAVDREIGALLAAARAAVGSGPLTVLVSAHGAVSPRDSAPDDSRLSDAEIAIPLVLHHPRALGRGVRVDHLVESVDLVPTILDLLGVSSAPSNEGRSLLPILRGDAPPRDVIYAEWVGSEAAAGNRRAAIRSSRWKALFDARNVIAAVFDLDRDPAEEENVAPRRLDVVQKLTAALDGHAAVRAGVPETVRPDVDPETEAHLRALGYLGGDAGPSLAPIHPDTVVRFAASGRDRLPRTPYRLGAPRGARASPGIRFLVGGDGVRSPATGRENLPSRVTPLVLGPRTIGYLWRARSPDPDVTAPLSPSIHDDSSAEKPHELVYLDAKALRQGDEIRVPLTEGDRWAVIAPDPGAAPASLRVEVDGALSVDVRLFAARDADTWRLVDDDQILRGEGVVRLPLRAGSAQAAVLAHRGGGGVARVQIDAATRAEGWHVIADDDGEQDSYRAQLSGSGRELLKVLMLERDPAVLTAARVVYRVGHEPYYAKLGKFLGEGVAPDAAWATLIVTLNGAEVYEAPLPDAACFGWHTIPIPVEGLRAGRNEVRFSVGGGDWVYFAVDRDSRHGRSGIVVGGEVDMSTLRPNREEAGELMVRLKVR